MTDDRTTSAGAAGPGAHDAAVSPSDVRRRFIRRIARVIGLVLLAVFGLWCVGAVAYSYAPLALRIALALVIGALVSAVLTRRRPQRVWVIASLVMCGAVWIWFISRAPTNDLDWAIQQSRPPRARLDGELVTIENVRNFRWPASGGDPVAAWETRTYDLDKLATLDLVISSIGTSPMAHICVSFGFTNGEYVHVSVEARRAQGEGFNPVAGQFRRYGLIYVISDERDSFGARARSGERMLVYPTRSHPQGVRMLFLAMLWKANYLVEHPAYYNLLFQNCTTAVLDHVAGIRPEVIPFDVRIWLNGMFDAFCYENGWIDTGLPIDEARAAAQVNDDVAVMVQEGELPTDFSQRLREKLRVRLGSRAPLQQAGPG